MKSRLVAVAALVFACCLATQTQAATVSLSLDQIVQVSLDGDRNNVGAVDGGSLNGSQLIARERANLAQEGLRIATFIKPDLSGLTAAQLNASSTTVQFMSDMDVRLNTINGMAVNLGRVDDDGVNGDTWDDSGAAGTVPLFEWGIGSADQAVLVPNVQTAAVGGTFTADVTSIFRDWLNGAEAQNGLVVFGASPQFQGAGFNDTAILVTFDIPEPTTALLGLMGAAGLARRRRKVA